MAVAMNCQTLQQEYDFINTINTGVHDTWSTIRSIRWDSEIQRAYHDQFKNAMIERVERSSVGLKALLNGEVGVILRGGL